MGQRKIVKLLKENPSGLTVGQIARRLHLSRATIYVQLKYLRYKQMIKKSNNRPYIVTLMENDH